MSHLPSNWAFQVHLWSMFGSRNALSINGASRVKQIMEKIKIKEKSRDGLKLFVVST